MTPKSVWNTLVRNHLGHYLGQKCSFANSWSQKSNLSCTDLSCLCKVDFLIVGAVPLTLIMTHLSSEVDALCLVHLSERNKASPYLVGIGLLVMGWQFKKLFMLFLLNW